MMLRTGSAWMVMLASAAVLGVGAAVLARPGSQVGAPSAGRDGIAVAAAAVTATKELDAFPLLLSSTGLYGADGEVDVRNRPFSPQYPLWTDGASKRRWVRLPDGAYIDVRNPDAWRFPAGTTFWKEFAFHGRPVETRMIRIRADGTPAYATYIWNADGTDASLVPEDGIPRSHEIVRGKWHAIPAVADCRNCHESGPSNILGFSALQLSDDRDPLAPHAEALTTSSVTLQTLVDEGRLRPAQPSLATHPPRLRARDGVERAALGYLSTNCGSCHNMSGPLARLGFSLRYEFTDVSDTRESSSGSSSALSNALRSTSNTASSIASAVGSAGRFAIAGDTAGSRLIEPGEPNASAVMHRMLSRRASTQMPPLGTVMVDSVGAALVRRWIERLR